MRKAGSLFFAFFGALIRWILNGFQNKFSKEFYGERKVPDSDRIRSNAVIGFFFVILLIFIVLKLGT